MADATAADGATVELRSMTLADLRQVLVIERESYSVPWSHQTFRGLVDRTDADAISAVCGDVVVGFAIAWSVFDQAEIGNIAVAKSWRSQGLGERLVRETVSRLAKRGVREVFLEVRVSNQSARRLYERLRFIEIGRRRNYYVGPVEDAIVMRRRLRRRNRDTWQPMIPG